MTKTYSVCSTIHTEGYNKYAKENFESFDKFWPKDVLSLNYFLKENQLLFQLFEAVHNDNQKYKTTVFPGMREQ